MTITNLQHVGLEVPDIDRALTFFTDAGLERYERDNRGVARCAKWRLHQPLAPEKGPP